MNTLLRKERKPLRRRDFIKTSAAFTGGLCLAAYIPELAAGAKEQAAAGAGVFAPNAFLRIAPDETVTIVMNHSEMGQGIWTGLAMSPAFVSAFPAW